MTSLNLQVNGEAREVDAEPSTPLIFVLRDRLGLTGAKLGCGLEQCGACAVLVDGESTLTCSRPVSEFEGRAITTAEGLADDPVGREVRKAFVAAGAAQCGYCTPGIVVAVAGLFKRSQRPDDAAIREALTPHLCRCGSHAAVLRAVHALAEQGDADGQ